MRRVDERAAFDPPTLTRVDSRYRYAVVLQMHPQLDLHKHPHCGQVITDFRACHLDHPYGKFFGYCNEARRRLNDCLQEEYEISAKEKRNTPTVMRVKARRILREDGTYEYQQVTPVERAHVKSEK